VVYTEFIIYNRFFQNSRNHLKILGARRTIKSNFRTVNPLLFSVTVKNLVARATRSL